MGRDGSGDPPIKNGKRIRIFNMEKKEMKAAQQRLDTNQEDQKRPLACKAEDHGWNGYISCLEDTRKSRACGFRMSFGYIYLCDNPRMIEQMRNLK
jgi:hypothetical protein